MTTNRTRRRGAIASPPHAIAAAMPHLLGASAPAPDRFLRLPQTLSYWGNRTDGCCVTTEEAFARACSGVFVTEAEALRWAGAHGVLNGAVISDVMDRFASGDGFMQDGNVYYSGRKLSIDYAHAATLNDAILQGPVKVGVAADQLDRVVGETSGWVASGFDPDRNLDHCVGLCGYGPGDWLALQLGTRVPVGLGNVLCYAMFTWATVGLITASSLLAITGEAWLRSPTTVVRGGNPWTADVVVTKGGEPPAPPAPFDRRLNGAVRKGGSFSVGGVPEDLPAGTLLTITPHG